jgi:diguanylate cyclase (GGDEF)-like protein
VLQQEHHAIENEILKSRTSLSDNTTEITRHLNIFSKNLNTLYQAPFLLRPFYKDTYIDVNKVGREFEQFRTQLRRFVELRQSLLDERSQLPELEKKFTRIFLQGNSEQAGPVDDISKALSAFTIASHSTELAPEDFEKYIDHLKKLSAVTEDPAKHEFINLLINQMRLIEKGTKEYVLLIHKLLNNPLRQELTHLQNTFQSDARKELMDINDTNRLLLALYLVSLTVIIYYIVKTQEENRRLEALKDNLEHSLVTDRLTGLGNRNAFHRDEETLQSPALILINIDRFKHINEFYGTHIGDKVLQEVARELDAVTPRSLEAKLYRLGGDDFGLLFEIQKVRERDLDRLLHYFHQTLESHTIPIEDLEIDLNFTLGASSEKGQLFETAGMALSRAKASANQPYLVYDSSIDRRKEIAQNITSIRHLRHALAEENLLPYYQPIVALKEPYQKKYEALARIEVLESGEVITPSNFMAMARESKLSGQITDEILSKTFEIARQNPDSIFSINLSTRDIEEPRIRRNIIKTIADHADIAPQIVIEILEGDEVGSYEAVSEFIAEVKRYGCKIAIDDFGSGYSNFEKLLKIDIDMIKIDGSLISKIDHDRHSELIVQTILDFAKYANLETVAEFVHSRSIYEKVVEMGFDYAQGYYLGEPTRSLEDSRHLPAEV